MSNETTEQGTMDCPGCGAPEGYPPAGPCRDHGTMQAVAVWTDDEDVPSSARVGGDAS